MFLVAGSACLRLWPLLLSAHLVYRARTTGSKTFPQAPCFQFELPNNPADEVPPLREAGVREATLLARNHKGTSLVPLVITTKFHESTSSRKQSDRVSLRLKKKKKKKEQARLLELSNCVDTKNLDPRHLKLYLPVCIALHVFILNLSGFHDTEFHSFFPKPELRSLNDLSSANVLMTASLSLLPTHWQTF